MIEINIEKNELLVNPETGKVMRSYTMQRPHADGKEKEPFENFVVAPEGGIIVPTKWAKAYDKGDKIRRNSILRNLQNQESAKQMKAGGIVSGTDLGVNVGPSMENGQFVKNTGVKSPYTSTGSFMSAGTSALSAVSNGASAAQTTNAAIDGYLGAATPWYGLAKTGSDLTRGIVQNTSGNTDGGKFMDKALTPAHTNLLDNIDKGDWGGAVSSLFTGGVSDWIKAPLAKDPKNLQQERQDLMIQDQFNRNTANTLGNLDINNNQDTMNPYKMKNGGRVPSYGNGGPLDYSRPSSFRFNNQVPSMFDNLIDPKNSYDRNYINLGGGMDISDDFYQGVRDYRLQQDPNDPKYTDPRYIPQPTYPGGISFDRNGNQIQTQLMPPNLHNNSIYRSGVLPSSNLDYSSGAKFPQPQGGLNMNNPAFNKGASYTQPVTDPYGNYKPRNGYAPPLGYGDDSADNPFNKNRIDPNAIAAGAGVLGNSVGSIYDMFWTRGGKKYDKVNYGQVAPHLISNDRALNEVDTSTAYGKENIRKLNPSGGDLLSAYTALAAKRASAKAGILESTNNRNADILNQNSQYNKGLEMQSMDHTAQNKARSEDIFRKGLRDTGANVMYGIKDYQTSKTNNLYMRMLIAKYGNNPQFQSFVEEQELNKG